jgi:hypothetical protein
LCYSRVVLYSTLLKYHITLLKLYSTLLKTTLE